MHDGWLSVNGERFFVKGIGYSPVRPGRVPWKDRTALDIVAQDFQQIRQAGFNTLRTWTPLTPQELALAKQYGLMVLQGIWVERAKDYRSTHYRQHVYDMVYQTVTTMRGHDNVLAVLVGNELSLQHTFIAGVQETEELLRIMYQAVKDADPSRLVSFANWPETAFLNQPDSDLLAYNTYDYNPLSVAHSLGYQGYLAHLRQTQAQGKPFIVTEFGLSVSPSSGEHHRYGGNSLKEQANALVLLWDRILEAGAQGGCVFEWADEWWKNYDYPGDELTHDAMDPEEWFGLLGFQETTELYGQPRPALEAMTRYNQAILVTPSSGLVQGPVPLEAYTTEHVHAVQMRVDQGPWQALTHVSPHWWRGEWDATTASAGVHQLSMQALDAQGGALTSATRAMWNVSAGNPQQLPWTVEIGTSSDTVTPRGKLVPLTLEIRVRNHAGESLAHVPVKYALTESQIHVAVQDVERTDEAGMLRIKYLVREPGILSCSAGVEFRDGDFVQQFGAERFVVIRGAATAATAAQPPDGS